MTLKEKADNLVEEMELFDDWMDKYQHIIEMGKSLPLIDEKYKDKQHLISGCQSQVWLHAEMQEDKIRFTADSDAVITKGISNLLVSVFDNESPQDILDADLSFIDEMGLKEHLSPTRSNGLMSMMKQIKMYALVFKAKQNK